MCARTLAAFLVLCCPPVWTAPNKSSAVHQAVALEEPVVINCTDGDGTTLSVTWVRLPDVSRSRERQLVTRSTRSDVSHSSDQEACCSLRIRNVSLEDAESYFCSKDIEDRLAQIRLDVTRVLESSSILNRRHLVYEVVICQGRDVELLCNVSGYSESEVSWRRHKDTFLFPGQSLLIPNVQRNDTGTYSCEASKSTGNPVSRNVSLVVEFPPVISLPNRVVNGSLEDECILECLIEAVPSPSITWFKEDIRLDQDDERKYVITTTERDNCTTLSILRVVAAHNENTTVHEFGNYTCQAENKHGRSSAIVRLLAPSEWYIVNDTLLVISNLQEHPHQFNVTGFIIGMMPPMLISFYIIIKLGYRSRYAEERAEEQGLQEEPFFISH